jgi:Zn-dependent protease with chaperone function
VKPSLREILANSHIPAVAIAVLLLWSLNWGFQALWSPLLRVGDFLFTAVAILKISYFSPTLTGADLFMLTTTLLFLFNALISLAAAWLLARWVYGVGPLRSLSKYRTRLARRNHV